MTKTTASVSTGPCFSIRLDRSHAEDHEMTDPTPFILKPPDLRGEVPESWACIDCGINTHPGSLNREQMERALALDWNNQGVNVTFDERTEVYTVKAKIWNAAGMGPMSGCLCIGCLEKRLGRMLTPKDFMKNDPFNALPGSRRLLARRYRGGRA